MGLTQAFRTIETRLGVFVGPQYVYDKGKDADGEKYFQYLHEVEPGEYTYYGALLFTGNGVVGSCYCMGSVKFEVRAGEITSLGDMMMMNWADNDARSKADVFYEPVAGLITSPIDFSTPSIPGGLPVVNAEFRAAGKMNNHYTAMVSRLPPMQGVLRYERDQVIDVKAEMAALEAENQAAEAARKEAAERARAAQEAEAAAQAESESAEMEDSVPTVG